MNSKADDHYRRNTAVCSNAEDNNIWSKLWKLSVPPKVRNFWWRVIKGFIPVRAILHIRHIELQSICVECGSTDDTIYHALLECNFANNFWRLFKDIYKIKIPKLHPLTWAIDILDTSICDDEKTSYILCGLWSVWNARNARLHGESSTNLTQACRWAYDTAADLIQTTRAARSCSKVKSQVHWQRPHQGCYKVNVDASYNVDDMNGASGVIIRDDQGI